MIRKHFASFKTSSKDKIKWRSHEPTRIEAFSDAVFAFAISLLVFSLEVPKSSEELLKGMINFIPFVFCFGSIFYVWYEQYKFFRRFGMHDVLTITLNAALIVVVLFYVYPLKFLFSIWMVSGSYTVRVEDIIPLMMVYNAGISCIYLLFLCMYCNAYAKREELGLNAMEVFETKTHVYIHMYPTAVGLTTIIFTLVAGRYAGWGMAGWGLMGGMSILGYRREKLYKRQFGNVPVMEPELGAE